MDSFMLQSNRFSHNRVNPSISQFNSLGLNLCQPIVILLREREIILKELRNNE